MTRSVARGGAAPPPRELCAVAEQAGALAAAWSPAGAPETWALTAAQFEVLRDDEELLALAATIPPERLPPLLFQAAATFLVLELEPEPLRGWFPRVGESQPPLGPGFGREYRDFCLDQRDRLLALCAGHRYQMNEVGRCAALVPALAPAAREGRPIALVDVGTGAGLALHLDRYRYVFRGPGAREASVGDPGLALSIETEVRGDVPPPLPSALPPVVERVGIDTEPLDLSDPAVRAWLAACIPQEIGAVERFHRAADIATAHPARTVRGDAGEVLPEVLAGAPDGALLCLIDSYVAVFLTAPQLEHLRGLVGREGARRDLDWLSIDPLVPMGPQAAASVSAISVPPELVQRNRREGVFGLVTRVSFRAGRREDAILGVAHPGAAWLEWLGGGAAYATASQRA